MLRLIHWSTIVLFSTVSVLGHGLHVFVGCGGHCGSCPVEHATADACCGRAGCAKKQRDRVACERLSSRHDPDDCSICRFMAQGQTISKPVLLTSHRFARPYRPVLGTISFAPPRLEAYSARAPPTVG